MEVRNLSPPGSSSRSFLDRQPLGGRGVVDVRRNEFVDYRATAPDLLTGDRVQAEVPREAPPTAALHRDPWGPRSPAGSEEPRCRATARAARRSRTAGASTPPRHCSTRPTRSSVWRKSAASSPTRPATNERLLLTRRVIARPGTPAPGSALSSVRSPLSTQLAAWARMSGTAQAFHHSLVPEQVRTRTVRRTAVRGALHHVPGDVVALFPHVHRAASRRVPHLECPTRRSHQARDRRLHAGILPVARCHGQLPSGGAGSGSGRGGTGVATTIDVVVWPKIRNLSMIPSSPSMDGAWTLR